MVPSQAYDTTYLGALQCQRQGSARGPLNRDGMNVEACLRFTTLLSLTLEPCSTKLTLVDYSRREVNSTSDSLSSTEEYFIPNRFLNSCPTASFPILHVSQEPQHNQPITHLYPSHHSKATHQPKPTTNSSTTNS